MNPDDTLDTLDTSIDVTALDHDALDHDDALDTEQIPALEAEEIEVTALNSISGGMRWEQFRRSIHVEDRRGPKAIARDQKWWDRTMAPAPVPLPPRRPEGI